MDAQGECLTKALNLYEVALDAWNHRPDVTKGDKSKENAPDDGEGYSDEGGEKAVTPVLGDGECGIAGFPNTIKAVSPVWLCNHIFKVQLHKEET